MSKYGAVRTEVDGHKFPSRGEARRWQDLKLAEAAGAIRNLRRQVRYPLVVNGMKVADYYADFVYDENGATVTEDFKGTRTDVYKLKRRLMKAIHGIDIFETGA